jgi:hypothetical protein
MPISGPGVAVVLPMSARGGGSVRNVAEPDQAGLTEISASDQDDFDALYAELRGVPGIEAAPVEPALVEGEQGSVLDLLTVACSGGAITVFLQIIRDLVDSRGPSFTLKMRRGKDRLEVNAENIDDVLPLIREMLGGSDS